MEEHGFCLVINGKLEEVNNVWYWTQGERVIIPQFMNGFIRKLGTQGERVIIPITTMDECSISCCIFISE